MKRAATKKAVDVYIEGERIPVRLNGWVTELIDERGEGISKPITDALCDFFKCGEKMVLSKLKKHCKEHNVSRNWMIEFTTARWLTSDHRP